jgi:hypothetical protein
LETANNEENNENDAVIENEDNNNLSDITFTNNDGNSGDNIRGDGRPYHQSPRGRWSGLAAIVPPPSSTAVNDNNVQKTRCRDNDNDQGGSSSSSSSSKRPRLFDGGEDELQTPRSPKSRAAKKAAKKAERKRQKVQREARAAAEAAKMAAHLAVLRSESEKKKQEHRENAEAAAAKKKAAEESSSLHNTFLHNATTPSSLNPPPPPPPPPLYFHNAAYPPPPPPCASFQYLPPPFQHPLPPSLFLCHPPHPVGFHYENGCFIQQKYQPGYTSNEARAAAKERYHRRTKEQKAAEARCKKELKIAEAKAAKASYEKEQKAAEARCKKELKIAEAEGRYEKELKIAVANSKSKKKELKIAEAEGRYEKELKIAVANSKSKKIELANILDELMQNQNNEAVANLRTCGISKHTPSAHQQRILNNIVDSVDNGDELDRTKILDLVDPVEGDIMNGRDVAFYLTSHIREGVFKNDGTLYKFLLARIQWIKDSTKIIVFESCLGRKSFKM